MMRRSTVVAPEWYRGFCISYFAVPVPDGPRWEWEHPDYDGAPDSGDERCGYGCTIADCERQIDELLDQEGDWSTHP